MGRKMIPHFEDVQAHYDLSDEFYELFLDPSRTYSCAYFASDDMPLEQAQLAKIDLSLAKLGLRPGMTLLDVGCGWGATMRRAVEKYDVNVIGLTLSEHQAAYVQRMFDQMDTRRSRQVRLAGWEQFDGAVDRIVSIGAFEHFGYDRYDAFFAMARAALPDDGVMLLHSITVLPLKQIAGYGITMNPARADFLKFIMTEIFPGGQLPSVEMVAEHAARSGFTLTRRQHLQQHYAKTLEHWAAALEANEVAAVEMQGDEVYQRYMRYLTGCAELFWDGYFDVNQFTLAVGRKAGRHRGPAL